MVDQLSIRPLDPGEETVVCDLVARVFNQFVASDYPQEGVDEFFRYANPEAMARRRDTGEIILVAEEGGEIVGMLELHGFDQIALLFVESEGHGVGRRLVEHALTVCRNRAPQLGCVRVHASRYAVPFYRNLGFSEEGPEVLENGITYLPMAFRYPAADA